MSVGSQVHPNLKVGENERKTWVRHEPSSLLLTLSY